MEYYDICEVCAREKGGNLKDADGCTVHAGECGYCKRKDVVLIPWVDFNWPKDKQKDRFAKANRD